MPYPNSLITETETTEALTAAQYATLAGVPENVVVALRAGIPWSGIDPYFRTLQQALGEEGIRIRARVESLRNQVWYQTKFDNQDRAVFAGIKTSSVAGG